MADLKAFRKANKLTQEQVADYLGIKKPFICKIETGREGFPDKHLRKLLDNPHGWDVTHLVGVSETITETTDTSEQPTEDVVVISTQVLEEMTAQRQLAEQALALVQEQLEAKQETIRITQEQLSTSQEQLTTSQEHLTTSQEQLSAEQQQTNNALASLAKSIERIDKAQAQMDELILMLKKEQSRQDQHLAKLEQERRDQAQKSERPSATVQAKSHHQDS